MRIGRRPLFFATLAVLCLIILDPTPEAYRWVNLAAAALAIFWGVLIFIEDRSITRALPKRERKDMSRNTKNGDGGS